MSANDSRQDRGLSSGDCPHCEEGVVWITHSGGAPCDRCDGTGRLPLHVRLEAEVARLRSIIDRPDPHDFMAASEIEARFQLDKWGTTDGFPTAFNSTADSDFVYLIAYLVGKVAATPDANLDKKLHRITTIAAAAANWHASLLARDSATP